MPPIDYEAEYNNRARVPEHAAIFARWEKEAAAYRDEARAKSAPSLASPTVHRRGRSLDIFTAKDAADAPLALFIHGGYWRSLEPRIFSHMARGLNARGIDVAVAGYDLCPQVTIGEIIDQMRQAALFLSDRFGKRITVYGHSAGGHLAACMLATDWKALDPKAPADLVPAAYAISGVFDLTPLLGVSMNQDLRLDEKQARDASPLFWPVAGRPRRSMPSSAGRNRASSCAKAKSLRTPGAKTAPRRATRPCPAPTISPSSIRSATRSSKMVERLAALCERTQAGR